MISLSFIHEIICNYFQVEYMYPFKRTKKIRVVYIRQIFHYAARKVNGYKVPFNEIASYLDDIIEPFHPSTVMHSCKQIEAYLSYDKEIRKDVKNILKMIKNG